MKVSVLGAGAFGTALGGVLADNGYDIDYYDPKIEKESLTKVLEGARYIVLCAPSFAVPHLAPHLPNDVPLIVATKGIMTERIFDKFKDWMVISGPGFADDIKNGLDTLLTATDERIDELFRTPFLRFDHTTDRRGVLMCGALKNIYAIGAGYRKLERDSAEWRDYIQQVAAEMKIILKANEAEVMTVDLACGVEDLKLTCGLPSRNYEFGLALQRDLTSKPEKTIEGVSAIRRIKAGDIVLPDDVKVLSEIMNLCG